MSALAALRRDVLALTPASVLVVSMVPVATFALGMIAIFPARFFA